VKLRTAKGSPRKFATKAAAERALAQHHAEQKAAFARRWGPREMSVASLSRNERQYLQDRIDGRVRTNSWGQPVINLGHDEGNRMRDLGTVLSLVGQTAKLTRVRKARLALAKAARSGTPKPPRPPKPPKAPKPAPATTARPRRTPVAPPRPDPKVAAELRHKARALRLGKEPTMAAMARGRDQRASMKTVRGIKAMALATALTAGAITGSTIPAAQRYADYSHRVEMQTQRENAAASKAERQMHELRRQFKERYDWPLAKRRRRLAKAARKASGAPRKPRKPTLDKNNDGWIDGQKPKGAKPRKTARPDDTLDPSSPNYRYADTGYVAGSRKELAALQIRTAAKNGERLRVTDVDWTDLESNPRQAESMITKANLFGKVDWAKLRDGGMEPGAAFLIDRAYASVAKAPTDQTPEGRKAYALGLETLRDRLERSKTANDVIDTLREISAERRGTMVAPDVSDQIAALNEKMKPHREIVSTLTREMDPLRVERDKAYNALVAAKAVVRQRERRGWKIRPEDTRAAADAQAKHDDLHARVQALHAKNAPKIEAAHAAIRELDKQSRAIQLAARAAAVENPTARAWNALGPRFADVASFASDTFRQHAINARAGKIANWDWLGTETTRQAGTAAKEERFQLLVADTYERVGGRPVTVDSTMALKTAFNLRDVQSGNWVLADVASAKFHTERAAEAFADLADIIGSTDSDVSLNGRLALAFGARGKGRAAAHYEPVERVINITKMGGGGALAHEWFHALDNMITEMESGAPTKRDLMATEDPSGIHDPALRAAVDGLRRAMHEGVERAPVAVPYTAADFATAARVKARPMRTQITDLIASAPSAEVALQRVNDLFEPSVLRGVRGAKKRQKEWLVVAAAWHGGNPEGGAVTANIGPKESKFAVAALALDKGRRGQYWSQSLEMGARAFQSYVEDKLAAQGRRNDYLSKYADNAPYRTLWSKSLPYPEGAERERINAAFDALFDVLRKRGTLRKFAARERGREAARAFLESVAKGGRRASVWKLYARG